MCRGQKEIKKTQLSRNIGESSEVGGISNEYCERENKTEKKELVAENCLCFG